MIKIFYFVFIPFLLFSSEYPHFTKSELINIEKTSGKVSRNRAMDYQKSITVFKTYNKIKQLNKTNFYLNQLLPQYDDVMQKQEDYWATPKEFLIAGYGDCEDYAIIKYFTLLKLGFDKKKLFFTTVFEHYKGGYHMVLSYFKNKNEPPLILDNLSFRVLDLKEREDIKADVFINSAGIFKINQNYSLKKIAHQSKHYNELMKRIKKNH